MSKKTPPPIIRIKLRYNHWIKRNTRSLERILHYSKFIKEHKRLAPIESYWWDDRPNFGDALTPLILPHYGIAPILSKPGKARLFGVGSIIELAPEDYDGYFWSSGKIRREVDCSYENAKFLAVRGVHTKEILHIEDSVPVGDGGLLISKVVKPSPKTEKIGFIPHYIHKDLDFAQRITGILGDDGIVIDVEKTPKEVAEQVSACSFIFTTSLHGLIFADAYSVPACWALPEPVLTGGDYKFFDYATAIEETQDRKVKIDDIRSIQDIKDAAKLADPDKVQKAQDSLEGSLRALYRNLKPEPFWKIIILEFSDQADRIMTKVKNKIGK